MSNQVSSRSSLNGSSKLFGVLLRATDLRLHYADKPILDGVSLLLESGSKVALTGRNGSGKTTLLHILTGQTKFEGGTLETFGRIGWLRQERDFAGQTVHQVMQTALAHLARLEQHLRELEAQGNIGQVWSDTLEAFERAGGYAAPAKAAATLEALGLGGLLEREASTLSGGEQTRLALAALLLENPDVLLLDEPTNHLDIAMREWLEKRLQDFTGALLIVSHDRRLLDAVCFETLHLEQGSLTRFVGGYSRARAARLELRRIQSKAARLGGFELRRLQKAAKTLNTWGANNDKLARRAKAIATRAERVVQTEAPAKERILRLQLDAGGSAAKLVLRAVGIGKHFVDKQSGVRQVLAKADLRLRLGDRVALLAPNGAGKTTLLRILLGDLAPDVPNPLEPPEVRYSDGVTVAYFDQTWHGLDAKKPVLEQLSAKVGERSAKALLGRYGFMPEAQTRAPRTLSGGERARAGLALIAATRADVLFLDEPTNHLDVETLEALEEAVLGYPGSVLFVTHDRQFAKAVATRVFTIEQGQLLEFLHGFAGYERFRRGERELLDPARLFEGEVAPPVVQRFYTPEQQLQLLEERLTVLEDYFLYRGMTEREWQRYRAEARAIVLRLSELHAERFALPLEFDFSMRFKPLQVRAIGEKGAWQFWAKNSSGCPFLVGNLENGVLLLNWQGDVDAALPWFGRSLLLGALGIALEQMGVQTVRLPEAVAPFAEVVGSLEYARALGLVRKPKKRRRRRKQKKSQRL
jgi:ATPase subunit of ABC transporter with duplicated ATPase domains